MADTSNPAPPPKKKNYAWAYYFAFLFFASVGVMVFMIWFNLSIQLTPEELQTARKLWEEKGPKNYNMIYTKRLNDDDRSTTFAVKVRSGKVQEVLMDGKPLEKTEERDDDPRIYHSMDSIYRSIDRIMTLDGEPKATRVYVTLKYSEKDGSVIEYIRRVMGTKQRVQITIEKLTPIDK